MRVLYAFLYSFSFFLPREKNKHGILFYTLTNNISIYPFLFSFQERKTMESYSLFQTTFQFIFSFLYQERKNISMLFLFHILTNNILIYSFFSCAPFFLFLFCFKRETIQYLFSLFFYLLYTFFFLFIGFSTFLSISILDAVSVNTPFPQIPYFLYSFSPSKLI